jgi:hypothetical protein
MFKGYLKKTMDIVKTLCEYESFFIYGAAIFHFYDIRSDDFRSAQRAKGKTSF